MTAAEVKAALGPLARQLARDAGWNENTWDAAVRRARDLTPEERAGLDASLKDFQAVVRKVRKAL